MAWGRRSHEHCSSLILIKVIRMAQKNTEDQTSYFSNDILPSHKQHSPDMTSHSVELGIQWVSTEAISQHSYSISYQIFFLDHSFQFKMKKGYVEPRGKYTFNVGKEGKKDWNH